MSCVHSDRGSVSLVLAAGLAAALVMTMGVADVATVLAARSSARTAADAAALAAAQELAFSTGADPAALAENYATGNGATLTSCACVAGGLEAVVEVSAPVGGLLLFPDDQIVIARARAVVDPPAAP